MAKIVEFPLPDLGEGLTEGEILQWFVAVGDRVKLNQPIVEVETAKAAVEIPSPYAGVVTAIPHKPGDVVATGATLVAFDTDPDRPAASPEEPTVEVRHNGERQAVLVGYGPRTGEARRRQRKSPAVAQSSAPTAPSSAPPLLPTIPDNLDVGVKPVRHGGLEVGRAVERAVTNAPTSPAPVRTIRSDVRYPDISPPSPHRVLAKPPVRKFARDLGVDLALLTGSGPSGIVTREDVQTAAQTPAPSSTQTPSEVDREHRVIVKGVRKHTADAMVASAFTAPHVTCFLDVDMTATMETIVLLRTQPEFADTRIGPLVMAAKAVLTIIPRYPMINSSWQPGKGTEPDQIVLKRYVNLGIAAATDRGLLVPNIKDAQLLSTPDLARAISRLVEIARAGKTPPSDMQGGTFTITNIGVFGVDAGTPIIPPGEAAILGVGAVTQRAWVVDGVVSPRSVCTLSLSFDHRIIDGEQGSKFLAEVGNFLHNPAVALLSL